MEKKTKGDKLETMTYAELEKEANAVLEKLQKADIVLDESKKEYDYGKKVLDEMEKRLAKMIADVQNEVREE